MAYADPTFEQHRQQILKGAKATTKTSGGGVASPSVNIDPSFTQHRQQVLSQPAPVKKVSTTPIAKPVVQQQPSFLQNVQSGGSRLLSQAGDFTADAIKKTLGLFTPKGGKPEPIHNEKAFVSPVPELTPQQQKAVGTLKVGQKIPDFKPVAQTFDNVIDTIFTKPAKFVLDDTGPLGNSIKKFATELYNDPVATLNPNVKNIQNLDPKLKKSMRENPIYKAQTATLQGIMQGALRVYANWNPGVESFLDKQVESVGNKSDSEIAGNTVGNIIGTIGSFVAGGEVIAALKFGKVALPLTFAALGQTSLPASTPVEARARNLIIDTVSGTLLQYIKPLANLEKMGTFQKTAAYTKQLSKSMAVLGTQTYLDARSVGATDEQAKEMVKDSVLILLGLHGFMIAGKAGSYATRSKFQEGSGVFTPEQARSIVVGSNLENTNLGNQIVKASLEAEAMGKNIKIDMTAAKKSKVAGVLNLQTPNGVKITNIEYVDGTPRVGEVPVGEKPISPEIPLSGPKSPVSPTEPIPGKALSGQPSALAKEAQKYKNVQDFLNEKAPLPGLVGTDKELAENIKKAQENLKEYEARGDQSGIQGETEYIAKREAILAERKRLTEIYNNAVNTEPPIEALSSAPAKNNSLVEPSKAQDLHHPAPDGERVAKYDRTLNVQDPEDAAYLERIFDEETVQRFKEGDFSHFRGGGKEYYEDKAKRNIISEEPKTPEQKLEGKVQPYELPSTSIYHGSIAGNTENILRDGFVKGSSLPEDAPRGGGYGAMQDSISFSLDPKIASRFTGQSPRGVIFEAKIKDGANIVTVDGITHAEELNDYIKVLKKQKVDGVYIEDEKEVVIINEKAVEKITRHQQFDVTKQKEQLAGFYEGKKTKSSPAQMGFNPKNLEEPLSPKATEEVKKIVKQSEIAAELSKKLGVPIRRGKFRMPGAIGVYKFGPKVVRIKSGGLGTVFHEVAHYLDDTIGLSELIPKDEWKTLMSEYGHSYEGQPKKQRMEAFAEYMRFRMTGQTEKIAQWGPKFDKIFQEKLSSMPDVESVIETATQDYKRWAQQPATSKILSQISIGGQKKPGVRDRAIQGIHDLYTSALDDLHPLAEFSKIAKKNVKNLKATDDPYILARNLRGWVGKADLFLNKGTFKKQFWTPDKKGRARMEFTGKSYSEIMNQVEKMNALDDFRVFIVAERIVNDLADRNIKTGISVDDAKTALKELSEKYPEFERISKERREYKDSLLEYAQESGLIGPKGLTKMRELNKYHVPFYRVMEETGTKFLGKTKIGGNLSSPIKKIKGSEREIIDPLESDVKDTYALINASERNNIGVAMANIAKMNFELGRLFEEVARPMAPVKVNVKEVMDQAMKGTDLEDMEIPDELSEIIVTLFRPTFASGPNMLNVNMGDKQKVFEVDSDLFQAIQGLNVEDVGLIMKLIAIPAKVLRAGATLSPDFSVRNPLRDQFTAFVYSKYGFTPGIDLMRGMFELFKKGDVYDLWKAAGGEHATFVSLDREVLQKNLKQVLSGKGEGGLSYVKNPLKILQILSELGEAGTRLGEMRNALAKGADPIEAAYASRNITLDFARIGAKTKAMNSIIAFLNAQLQSTDTTIRRFKERPFQTLWKVLVGITLPSILLYFANRDDPRWKEIPQWQKDLFWIVLTPEHIYRIPKPFELGVIFGSGPERALEAMETKDPEMFKQLNQTIMEGFTPGWMPTGMIPIVENLSNYSFFLDRPIVSPGKENLPPSQQAGPYTTEVSKVIGEALNYSPAKIDNLVSGYGGGLGKYAQQGIDKILIGTGVVQVPPKPAKKLEEMPVIKAFMIREPIGSGSESVNRVYTKYNSSNQQLTYVKQLVKAGKPDEATAYVKAHPETIDAIILTNVVNTFSDMNKAVDQIKQSEKLTPQEKAKKIDQIGILQTNLAQKTLQELKNRKK